MNTNTSLTVESIKNAIKAVEYHRFPETTVTICLLTLWNGFNVVGESACVDPDNFDELVGREVAHNNAVAKVWMLEGYLLKTAMFTAKEGE